MASSSDTQYSRLLSLDDNRSGAKLLRSQTLASCAAHRRLLCRSLHSARDVLEYWISFECDCSVLLKSALFRFVMKPTVVAILIDFVVDN